MNGISEETEIHLRFRWASLEDLKLIALLNNCSSYEQPFGWLLMLIEMFGSEMRSRSSFIARPQKPSKSSRASLIIIFNQFVYNKHENWFLIIWVKCQKLIFLSVFRSYIRSKSGEFQVFETTWNRKNQFSRLSKARNFSGFSFFLLPFLSFSGTETFSLLRRAKECALEYLDVASCTCPSFPFAVKINVIQILSKN